MYYLPKSKCIKYSLSSNKIQNKRWIPPEIKTSALKLSCILWSYLSLHLPYFSFIFSATKASFSVHLPAVEEDPSGATPNGDFSGLVLMTFQLIPPITLCISIANNLRSHSDGFWGVRYPMIQSAVGQVHKVKNSPLADQRENTHPEENKEEITGTSAIVWVLRETKQLGVQKNSSRRVHSPRICIFFLQFE